MTEKSSPENYFELINDLVRKISTPGLTEDALCQYLVVRSFSPVQSKSGFISKLHKDGKVRPIVSCGIPPEMMSSWKEVSFSEHLPINDSMRADKMIWLADKEDWAREYPDLLQYMLDDKAETFIAIPIDLPGTSVSGIGVMSHGVVRQTKELTSYLWTIGGLISLFFSKNFKETESEFLTPRQLEILQFMYDGYTNHEIANELGFSESTVRQETMRIYQIMSASGRKEAIALGIKQNLIKEAHSK